MEGRGRVDDAMRRKLAQVGWRVAELAGTQHGVVARWQLVAMGVPPRTVDRWIAAGRLHAVHRGVYAVGHRRLTQHGLWMAAVLACGQDALLSHRSGTALWGLLATTAANIDVTVPSRGG